MNVKIEKIKIRIGDTEAEMTLEQARELKLVLDELFPAPAPFWPPVVTPIIIERDRWIQPSPYWKQWETTCSGDSATLCISTGAQ